MSSNVGNLPPKVVLDFTALYQPCSGNVGTQIQQGNSFSIPFDLSQVRYEGGNWNGTVYVTTDAENNFQAASPMKMFAEGLAGKVAFMFTGQSKATVFSQQEEVTRVYIIGTPSGDDFTWQAGIIVGGCAVVSGEDTDEVASKLS
ncbi:MAG TPA: hypothetical protein VKA70_20270 [Blastocatellia bacterium]|nr:hypothetical protein [Blastocatellia bacterium]